MTAAFADAVGVEQITGPMPFLARAAQAAAAAAS